jgi:hypothetical protein
MIVLAREIASNEPPILPLLDVTVERNAFGRQLDSFEAELAVPILGDRPVHAVFIRAPIIERTSPEVDVLATLEDGRIVAVRERNILATAFHPELAGETRFHRLMATMAAEHDDPGEGSGRRPHRPGAGVDGEVLRRSGKVAARLTDLAALASSRDCANPTRRHALACRERAADRRLQLFRLPWCFQPNDLSLYEEEGIAGLVRVEREAVRDEWTIVELDAVGMANAGDIRYRLVQQLLREGAKRAAARFHVPVLTPTMSSADAAGSALRRGAVLPAPRAATFPNPGLRACRGR